MILGLDPATPTLEASTGGAPIPNVDGAQCHRDCENLYGATDPASFAKCVADCAIIAPPDCGQFGVGACTPNWIPLPGSGATQQVPLSVKLGVPAAALLIGVLVLAAFVLRVNVNA